MNLCSLEIIQSTQFTLCVVGCILLQYMDTLIWPHFLIKEAVLEDFIVVLFINKNTLNLIVLSAMPSSGLSPTGLLNTFPGQQPKSSCQNSQL